MSGWLAVPLVVFFIFVAPLWLLLHYRSKRKMEGGLTNDQMQQLQDLAQRAEVVQKRVQTLEKILDAESPNWRRDHDQ
ncbi:MAG: envelope stress response membrane protein PspB [Vibrio sp.]